MNTPQEQRRIERERRRRMKKKQGEIESVYQTQRDGNDTGYQREPQPFQPMTQDELFTQEPADTAFESGEKLYQETKPFAAHKWFVALALIFGVMFVFLTPPFQVPDEMTHFLKSYSLSEFRLIPRVEDGVVIDEMDSQIMDFVSAFGYLNRHPENKTSFRDIGNWNDVYTSTFNEKEQTTYVTVNAYIIYYLPQAFGMAVAHLFGLSVLWTLFMGRLFNLFFYVAILYLAIKTTPVCKNLFFLLALLPMAVFQAASLSYDVMVISVCALFIAEVLNLIYNPHAHFTTQSFVKILILSIILTFVKTVYFPLVLLLLAIPAAKFGTRSDRFRAFAQIVVASLAVYVIIAIFRKILYAGVVTDNTMSTSQIITVITNPIRLLSVVQNTFQTFGSSFVEEFIGKLGWLDVVLPGWLIGLYYIGLIGALFEMNKTEISYIRNNSLSDTFRLVALTALALTGFVLLLFAVFYYILTLVTLGKEGATIANGIQGRYFIPVAYPALTALAALLNYKITFGERFYQISKTLNVVLVIVAQIVSIVSLTTRYYVS